MQNQVQIEMTGHGQGKVLVDGEKVPMVTEVEVSLGVGKTNLVTITSIADQVTFSGPAKVRRLSLEGAPTYFEFNHRRTMAKRGNSNQPDEGER